MSVKHGPFLWRKTQIEDAGQQGAEENIASKRDADEINSQEDGQHSEVENLLMPTFHLIMLRRSCSVRSTVPVASIK